MHLAHDAEGEVLEVYGAEREVCILASTVQQLEYDGRFSFGNKAWAKGYEIPENVSRGMDMNADYVVNSHLAVLDELIGLVREVIWEQELGKKENMQINEETKGVIANGHFGTWHMDYEQVYMARMQPEDEPGQIRKRFNEKLPRTFHGHSISVSDVLVLNKGGVVTSYYVEKDGFTVIAGFIRISSSGTLVSLDTTDFHIKGKEGKWLAFDSIIIEGRQFFLMEHETYGKEVAWVVLDEEGKLVVDHAYHGFDQSVQQQIKDYLNPPQLTAEPQNQEISGGHIQMQSSNAMDKPPLENWQKYMENGEYLRSSEIDEEQNYNMIDGRRNNMSPKGKNGRVSILTKLRRKQAEIAKRSVKPAQQMEMAEDMERRRK